MKLHKDIERFRGTVSGGYSQTSNRSQDSKDSIYIGLYDLMLQHIIKYNPSSIKEQLKTYLPLLENGLLSEKKKYITSTKHDSFYVSLHVSSIYYQLVDYYIENHPKIDVIEGISMDGLYDKLNSLDYSDAWKVSNEVMSYAVLLAFNSKNGPSVESVQWCLDYVKKKQNPRTGLWDSQKEILLINSVAATFHYLPLYDYLGESVDYPVEMLKAVLSMRLPNGFFSSPAGYACIDYDCIAILLFLVRQHFTKTFIEDADLEEISHSALELRSAVIRIQNSDGGFPEFGGPLRPVADSVNAIISFSKHRCFRTYLWNMKKIARLLIRSETPLCSNSVSACVAKPFESNAFATWFRYMTISACEEILVLLECKIDRVSETMGLNMPGLGRL